MRPGGKDGFLYRVKFGTLLVGGAAVTIGADGFVKIVSKASAGSGFPAKDPDNPGRALGVGDVYFAKAAQTLVEGDSVLPMPLKRISFVTDVSDQAQGQTHDVTTQDDIESGARSYIPGAFKERSGSINGVVDTDSEEQLELLNEYRKIVTVDGEFVTVQDAATMEHEYMLSRRETDDVGEVEIWEYLPIVSESINMSKPMDGAQSFSFNYKVDGKRKPALIRRIVAA